jgi:hypothetical protein
MLDSLESLVAGNGTMVENLVGKMRTYLTRCFGRKMLHSAEKKPGRASHFLLAATFTFKLFDYLLLCCEHSWRVRPAVTKTPLHQLVSIALDC